MGTGRDNPTQGTFPDRLALDGPTLCRALRRQARQEPLYLILLTARGESGDIVRGLDAGADDYIAKPYDYAELRARIDVGWRVLRMQGDVRERQILKGVLEMAGAVCHEMGQPMQVVSGYSELLLMDRSEAHADYEMIREIKAAIDRMGELTHKIMTISRYRTKPYMGGKRLIVDLDR